MNPEEPDEKLRSIPSVNPITPENFVRRNLKTHEEHEYSRRMRTFQKTLKHTLATTRFNNFTWEENCKMRQKNPNTKCIYACPISIATKVRLDSTVFVFEMNNDTDTIMGIGLIKNHPVVGKYVVHSVHNYNRFVYIGKWRIDREDMSTDELEILRLLEAICFRGVCHSKRGQGITALPIKLQYKSACFGFNLMDSICDMFRVRMNT